MSYTLQETAELMAVKATIEQGAMPRLGKAIKSILEELGITATVNIDVKVEGVDLDTFHKYADNKGNNDIWGQLGLK